MRQPLQRLLSRVPGATLDTTDIRLRDTGQPGELSLRQAPPDPGIPELQAKSDASGEHRPDCGLRRIGRLGVSQVITEPGSHS